MSLFHCHEHESDAMQHQHQLLHRILEVEELQLHELRAIRKLLTPLPITSFIVFPENPMNPLIPGSSHTYTAADVPAGATLDPNQPVPTWTSSDTTNAPVTADSTGLVGTVAIPAGATVGSTFTLTVNYTNADGTTATGSSDTQAIVAAVQDVTGFTVERTS